MTAASQAQPCAAQQRAEGPGQASHGACLVEVKAHESQAGVQAKNSRAPHPVEEVGKLGCTQAQLVLFIHLNVLLFATFRGTQGAS